jgi:hypothetical protein
MMWDQPNILKFVMRMESSHMRGELLKAGSSVLENQQSLQS